MSRALDDSVQEIGRRLDELARDRSRMEAILAGMIEGVIVVDPAGRVQLANQAARHMLRLEALALGRHYVETIRHPAIADLVGSALAGRTPESVQLSPPRDDTRTLMARAAPVTSGVTHGAVLVLHDITDLKRADQIRRDFVANVSHELRTPLTAIRGYVEALSEPDTSAEDRGRQFLDIIMTARAPHGAAGQGPAPAGTARRRAGDAGGHLVRHRRADPMRWSATSRRRSRRASSACSVHIAPGAETVQADPAKLHDVLRNLIVNASTYAPAHERDSHHGRGRRRSNGDCRRG